MVTKGKKSLVSLVTVLVGLGFAWPGGHIAGEAADGAVRQAAAGEREEAAGGDRGREAALEFGGARGTEFSGTCAVDGKKRTLEGEVPERLELSPDGGRLECEIRKEGPGDLKLTFTAGENARSVQRINTPGTKVEILYEDGSLSTSTLSSGGAHSSSQRTTVSGSSQSVVSSSQVVGSFSSTSSR